MEDFVGYFMDPVADFFCQSFHKLSKAALQLFVVHDRHDQVAGDTHWIAFPGPEDGMKCHFPKVVLHMINIVP